MTTSQVLQHLYSLDASSPDFLRYLHCLIRNDEEEQYLHSLRGMELTQLIDFLDEVLGVAPIADDVFRRCLHKLQTICSHHAILPSSYTISGDLSRVGDDPVAFGGFSEVWKGTYNSSNVCVKRLRVSEQIREAVEKAFCKEAIVWKRMKHPNIVAFIGVTRNPLQFVSEWMPNGTLTEYVNKNPGANRVGLLLDVAEGLNYLHANHTSHGDLKGPNILVDHSGHACLTDFGFTSVVRGLNSILVTEVQGYTARWAAPEVLESGDRNTREADIFAFGMVVVEVFTGKCPFSEFMSTVTISKILDGERPDRPQEPGLTDSVWDMTRACWRQDPTHRPTITGVVGILRECYSLHAVDLHLSSLSPSLPVKNAVKKKNSGHVTMPLGFSRAYQRINEIAEELANRKEGPKGNRCIKLLELCSRWRALPASYELEGVAERGGRVRDASPMTQVWSSEGTYGREVVALKVLRLHKGKVNTGNEEFFKDAVLMMQLEHDNIRPFYGVSTTISDISLVFPWYKNGNIVQYLENNPGVNRHDLVLGAVEGLLFLHSNGAVHGDLRPSRILIDDGGNARLAIDSRCTPSLFHSPDASATVPKDIFYREALLRFLANSSDDVCGMAMVVCSVLTGIAPYWERCSDNTPYPVPGGIPARPPGAIDDPVWEFLNKCWSDAPEERPPMVELYRTLKSDPKVIRPFLKQPVVGELPEKLELRFHSIEVYDSAQPLSRQPLYVKFEWGFRSYTTSPTNPRDSLDRYTWSSPENFVIQTGGEHHGSWVSLKVLKWTGPLKKDKAPGRLSRSKFNAGGPLPEGEAYETEHFSLMNSANKQIVVNMGYLGPRSVNVRIFVVAM